MDTNMSFEDLGVTGLVSKILLVDGDIIVYQPCTIYTEDDDASRRSIGRKISNKLDKLMTAAGCDRYMFFLTTKFNFRNELVDDYKANRSKKDRPVNLEWAKKFAVKHLNAHYVKGLEADDLLGIYMKEDCVIWSIDKDLRQIPGEHLDDDTQKVITITEEGRLEQKFWVTKDGNPRDKIYFEGDLGLYHQMLIGDKTDNILGCAQMKPVMTKTGANKGQVKVKRVGVGEKASYKAIIAGIIKARATGTRTDSEAALAVVIFNYKKIWGDKWQVHLETQANLLFMVRMMQGDIFRRWTYDGRKEYFHLIEGRILTEEEFINDYKTIKN